MKTTTNIIYSTFALFALSCFAFAPQARAVCQEGCLTNNNTVLGEDALISNTGFSNTAIGFQALGDNTTGEDNTATGVDALFSNTAGSANTATGFEALVDNLDGGGNTATGAYALFFNGTGSANTATGGGALVSNTIGSYNTATGSRALNRNTTGNYSTASGVDSLYSNTTGNNNTANGDSALFNNTTGSFNIALGANAGFKLTTGSNNIEIGSPGTAGDTKTIRIGKQGTQTATYIAGISGATVASGVGVIVGSNGQLGTVVSSERFKDAIKPMDNVSEAIFSFKPVTFHYKKDLDPKAIPQFGLVAEEVEKVNPDLVARDEQGKPYTVRYEAVNAMLLNEFLKEHRTVQDLRATVAQQQKQIEALTAGLQKVSAQVESSKRAPQMANNR